MVTQAQYWLDGAFIKQSLDKKLHNKQMDDSISQMEAFREFKHEHLNEIRSHFNCDNDEFFSTALTLLSEVILQKVFELCMIYILNQHPFKNKSRMINKHLSFAVIGYGNLGARELNDGSDLDLVFLYDLLTDANTVDERLDACLSVFATKVAQRMIYFLTTPLANGILFPVDVRLRPDGNAGLLVRSFFAFEKYLHENAWNFEHAALIKSRVVLGAKGVHARFEMIRKNVLMRKHNQSAMYQEFIALRLKMNEKTIEQIQNLDLKTMEGGISDIDSIVQSAILHHIKIYPDLIVHRNSLKILVQLREYNLLSKEVVASLTTAYQYYQMLQRKYHVPLQKTFPEYNEIKMHLNKVKAIWLNQIVNPLDGLKTRDE